MTSSTTLRILLTIILIGLVINVGHGIGFLLNQPSDLTFIGGLALLPVTLAIYLGLYHLIWRKR